MGCWVPDLGRLLAFRDGHMWWQDVFRTAYFDRSDA
jgi:hypothetical protein